MKSQITGVLLAMDFSQCATRALEQLIDPGLRRTGTSAFDYNVLRAHVGLEEVRQDVKEPMLEAILERHKSQLTLVESSPASY